MKVITSIVTALLVLVVVGYMGVRMTCLTVVEPGEVGVVTQFGSVEPKPIGPGAYIMSPFKSVKHLTTQPLVHDTKASAATTNLQTVDTDIAVTYWLTADRTPDVYQRIGDISALNAVLLDNNVQQSLKEVTGTYTPEDLMHKREEVKMKVEESLRSAIEGALATKNLQGAVVVGSIAIKNFEFSDTFNQQINKKVQSEQEALQVKATSDKQNILSKATADAQKLLADANAYATEVRSKANADKIRLTTEALKANPGVLELRQVQKWDGEEPEYWSCGPLPFLGVTMVPCPSAAGK